VAFEVDGGELQERIRRATGNPYVRGLRLRHVEVFPRDESWWSGRHHRRAWIALSELDLATLSYIREISPGGHRRLVRLLADLLEVGEVEFLALPEAGDFARGARRRAQEWARSLDHHQVLQLREGRLVDQLQRPQLVD
jgi:hypothetical protein